MFACTVDCVDVLQFLKGYVKETPVIDGGHDNSTMPTTWSFCSATSSSDSSQEDSNFSHSQAVMCPELTEARTEHVDSSKQLSNFTVPKRDFPLKSTKHKTQRNIIKAHLKSLHKDTSPLRTLKKCVCTPKGTHVSKTTYETTLPKQGQSSGRTRHCKLCKIHGTESDVSCIAESLAVLKNEADSLESPEAMNLWLHRSHCLLLQARNMYTHCTCAESSTSNSCMEAECMVKQHQQKCDGKTSRKSWKLTDCEVILTDIDPQNKLWQKAKIASKSKILHPSSASKNDIESHHSSQCSKDKELKKIRVTSEGQYRKLVHDEIEKKYDKDGKLLEVVVYPCSRSDEHSRKIHTGIVIPEQLIYENGVLKDFVPRTTVIDGFRIKELHSSFLKKNKVQVQDCNNNVTEFQYLPEFSQLLN